jgi:hypothetical protein
VFDARANRRRRYLPYRVTDGTPGDRSPKTAALDADRAFSTRSAEIDLTEIAEERPEVGDEQLGFLHGGEVSARLEL